MGNLANQFKRCVDSAKENMGFKHYVELVNTARQARAYLRSFPDKRLPSGAPSTEMLVKQALDNALVGTGTIPCRDGSQYPEDD